MDTHVKFLSTFSIIVGVLSTLFAVSAIMWYGGIGGVFTLTGGGLLGYVLGATTVLNLLLGLPLIVGGFFVGRYAEWARSMMIVICGLNLVNAPIGSALGIYGLWVLMTPETDPLFKVPPRRRRQTGIRSKKVVSQPMDTRPLASPISPVITPAEPHLPK